jgi:hypothetical protein
MVEIFPLFFLIRHLFPDIMDPMNNDIKLLLLALITSATLGFIGFCIGRATSTPTDFAVWYDAPGSDETMGTEGRIDYE